MREAAQAEKAGSSYRTGRLGKQPMNNSVAATAQPRRLPPGQHPGQAKLKSQAGVYRCCLRPDIHKRDEKHADYKGTIQIGAAKCSVLLWCHLDGSVGLRLEKIRQPEPAKST